ncbi:hypothetical protein [Gemmata sp.]|uniref:hypothetical protein n=1 Tax=Gemmata sp. TaxID=1914242 RepID=UPI003F6E6AB2
MIRLYTKNAVLLAVVAAASYELAAEFGPWPALLTCAAAAAAASAAGAFLLRTSGVGRVTWRNRLAGYLIPWGWRLNRGKLWPIPVVSWAVWTAVCGAAVLLRPAPDQPALGTRAALLAAWVIDAAALVYLLGTLARATPGGRVGPIWKLVAVIAGVISASVGLYVGGQTTAALVVGGGPPVVVGGGFGLLLLFVVTVGRNTRWN